jgi:aminoglycoside 6'-N-acetyltransferase I
MVVRRAVPGDSPIHQQLRALLWPAITEEENRIESPAIIAAADQAVFLAETPRGDVVGFAEVALRQLAEGCDTHPVGYLEGWYVRPEARHRGVGRRLMEASEEWARQQGCTEMASDTELENVASTEAHQRLGYTVVARLVAFRKPLTRRGDEATA